MKKPSFIRSVDTTVLINHIRDNKDAEVITYKSMCVALRVSGMHRPTQLSSALKALRDDDKLVFAAVRGEGIQLLQDADRLKCADALIVRTRKAAKRTARVLTTVDQAKVGEKAFNAACAKVAILHSVSDKRVQASLETGLIKALPNEPITPKRLAEIFN